MPSPLENVNGAASDVVSMEALINSLKDALNLSVMDVDTFITKNNIQEVTSPFIHVPSSPAFDPEGIFSEAIFGAIASQMRLIRHGYINLNCHVFHPIIFQNLLAIKRFYGEIMSGKSYAKWDPEIKDFVRADESEEGADTGYSFFLSHFNQINFETNESLKRNDKVRVIEKYKDRLLIDKILVLPAGWRDLNDEDGRVEKDSINTLYIALLERARAMPPMGDTDAIYDAVHYSVQRKVMEIYEYLFEFARGKRGFLEGKFGARSIAMGTRNVITSSLMEAESPDSPQYHKLDEVKVPLYQAAKGYTSLVVYWLKSLFYSPVIQDGADQIPIIDPDDLKQIYVRIDDKDKDTLLTSEGVNKTLDRFRDVEYRWRPVTAMSEGKPYYLYLVYDDKDEISIFRNLEEFKEMYERRTGAKPDMAKVRPLCYAEMIYVATYQASLGRSGYVTRYPVTDEQSCFVAKTHLCSTAPARVVKFITNVETGASIELPEYPIIGAGFVDALRFHPSKRAGLGADYDGDTVTWGPLLSDEANKECEAYYHSVANFVFPNGEAMVGTDDLIMCCLYTLTEEPKEK